MLKTVSIQWVFFVLGFVFWIIHPEVRPLTLLCVFYSFFAGTVWKKVPPCTGLGEFGWKRLLPPLFLVLLMMISARLVPMIKSEVVPLTAMALIHFRAFLLSTARFKGKLRGFGLIQISLTALIFVYLFQDRTVNLHLNLSTLSAMLMVTGAVSIALIPRAPSNESASQTDHS